MHTLVVDFETYYDSGFSLKKLPTILYVRDPRCIIHGVGVQLDDAAPQWLTDMDDLRDMLRPLDEVRIVGHNLLFDGLILTERVGLPSTLKVHWADTLAMARGLIATDDYSLDTLATALAGQSKIKGVLAKTAGKAVLSPFELEELGRYCLQDIVACRALYAVLEPMLPESEKELIHITIEMGVKAQLNLDASKLQLAVEEETTAREAAIQAAGISRTILGSNIQFAKYLEELGYTPPRKVSVTTGNETWAFAKGDQGWDMFKKQHPELKDLLAGREACKSSIQIDRAEVLRRIALTGQLPVPLKYYGGHTGRFSGAGGGINLQNLPRTGRIRGAIKAPPGKVLLIADYAQIEARVVAWLGKEDYMLEAFREGKDIYKAFAARLLNCSEEQIDKNTRQKAKSMVLGLGYGMGPQKFSETAGVDLEEATENVRAYRQINAGIVAYWKECQQAIQELVIAVEMDLRHLCTPWGCMTLEYKALRFPNGMRLKFPYLHRGEDEVTFTVGSQVERIYAGKLCENITQGLARIIMTDALRTAYRAGFNPVFTCHDEIVLLVDEDRQVEALEGLTAIMTLPPYWAPDLPLAVEAKIAKQYGK